MFEDHMLPMIQIFDKKTGETITQIYNFLDLLGGPAGLNVDSVEAFLFSRGVLQKNEPFTDPKHKEAYTLTNNSSYLYEERTLALEEGLKVKNERLEHNTELKEEINYDPATIKYKEEIIKAFRMVADPFNVEIGEGEFDFEQNPAEPSKPTKKEINIKPFDPLFE